MCADAIMYRHYMKTSFDLEQTNQVQNEHLWLF